MKKSNITLADIAESLQISPSTVSRALSNHPDISAETKEKVANLAKELNYFPNSIAQSLQKKSTKTIGVIVPEIKHHFFSSVISGIEDVAYTEGYTIMVCQSNESHEREVINTKALMSNRVAGILVSASQTIENSDHFRMLQKQGIPLVLFDRIYEDIGVSQVVVDDFNGAFKAVEHLIQSGYKKIAHLAGFKSLSIGYNRKQGYLAALNKYNIPIDEEMIVSGGFDEEDGAEGFEKLLEIGKQPDAIFGVNDPVIVGAYIKIKEKGLRIPEDIALVGFSDAPITMYLDPPITTVDQPGYEMGHKAVQILLEQIKNPLESYEAKTEIVETELIIRGSTVKK